MHGADCSAGLCAAFVLLSSAACWGGEDQGSDSTVALRGLFVIEELLKTQQHQKHMRVMPGLLGETTCSSCFRGCSHSL